MGIAPKNPKQPAWSFDREPTTKSQPGLVAPEPVTIEDRLKHLIGDEFCIDENDITPNAHLIHDLELDSLDIIELAIACEEVFSFEFDEDHDIESLSTFSKWLDVVNQYTQGAKQ